MLSASLQAASTGLRSVGNHSDLSKRIPLLLEALASILTNNPEVATFDGKELKVFDQLHFLTKLTSKCQDPIADDQLTGKMARLGLIKIQKQKSGNENSPHGSPRRLRFQCRRSQTSKLLLRLARIEVKSKQMRGQLKDTLTALKNDFHSDRNSGGDSMAMIQRIYRFGQLNRDIYQMAVHDEPAVLEEIELQNFLSEEGGEIQFVKPRQQGPLSMCNLHSKVGLS